MKKCLAFALAALSVSIPALAAVGDTGFSDVDADAWYTRERSHIAGNIT